MYFGLIKHHTRNIYVGVEVQLHALTLELYIDQWSASHPGCFTPSTHWTDPRASLNMVVKRKKTAPARNQNPAVQPTA